MAKLQTIPPALYQRMGLQQARLKSMPRGKFIQWITDFYNDAYKTGWNECMDKYNAEHGGISISEDIDAAVMDADSLYNLLLSIKGIGNTLATRILNTITEEMQ